MKKIARSGIILMLITSTLFSCEKPVVEAPIVCAAANIPEGKATIAEKWNIVTDSTFAGIGTDNYPVNYVGQKDDYFDFRSNGKLYIKKDLKLDTLNYWFTSDTTIITSSSKLNDATSFIKNLTAHSVTITTPIQTTPNRLFGQKVVLSR